MKPMPSICGILVVDQHEIEIALARAGDRLDRIKEGGRLDETFGLDVPLEIVEDGSAVVDQKRFESASAESLEGLRREPWPIGF